ALANGPSKQHPRISPCPEPGNLQPIEGPMNHHLTWTRLTVAVLAVLAVVGAVVLLAGPAEAGRHRTCGECQPPPTTCTTVAPTTAPTTVPVTTIPPTTVAPTTKAPTTTV